MMDRDRHRGCTLNILVSPDRRPIPTSRETIHGLTFAIMLAELSHNWLTRGEEDFEEVGAGVGPTSGRGTASRRMSVSESE
jgi:hypothetical protein